MTTVNAIDKVFLFKIEGESGIAWKVAYQSDIETDESRDYESTPTKDGTHMTPGAYEGTHSMTSFLAKDDVYVRQLRQLIRERNPRKLMVWEIDRSDIDDASTIPGEYSQDVVNSVNISSGSEGNVEVSIESSVVGTIVSGEVEVTEELKDILQQLVDEDDFVQPTESGPIEGA